MASPIRSRRAALAAFLIAFINRPIVARDDDAPSNPGPADSRQKLVPVDFRSRASGDRQMMSCSSRVGRVPTLAAVDPLPSTCGTNRFVAALVNSLQGYPRIDFANHGRCDSEIGRYSRQILLDQRGCRRRVKAPFSPLPFGRGIGRTEFSRTTAVALRYLESVEKASKKRSDRRG